MSRLTFTLLVIIFLLAIALYFSLLPSESDQALTTSAHTQSEPSPQPEPTLSEPEREVVLLTEFSIFEWSKSRAHWQMTIKNCTDHDVHFLAIARFRTGPKRAEPGMYLSAEPLGKFDLEGATTHAFRGWCHMGEQNWRNVCEVRVDLSFLNEENMDNVVVFFFAPGTEARDGLGAWKEMPVAHSTY